MAGAPDAAPAIPVVLIKAAAVHGLVRTGTPPILVDVRTREEYQVRHIKGAISIPLDEIAPRAGELPPRPLMILY